MSSINVQFPQFYWLADTACFPELTQDPDLVDQLDAPRHPDKHYVNWAGVGAVVQDIGNRLIQGEYKEDPDDPDWAEVAVDYGTLSDDEREIVNRWFQHGACPCGDPVSLENGRHRLWNCWSANRNLMLPVESSILCLTLEPPGSRVHELLPCSARAKLNAVTPIVRERSSAYVDRLVELSSRCAVDNREGDDHPNATTAISLNVDEPTTTGTLSLLKRWFEHLRPR